MPKGDRLKLKADPEDGTTPISNLLLDAVAIAKLSGLHKGAILHLWRVTYGWLDNEGQRKKEAKITLSEWAKALDTDSTRSSKTLTELVDKNIITRRTIDNWGGYYYKLNTDIMTWNSGSINRAKLRELIGIPNLNTIGESTTVGENATIGESTTVGENNNATVGENAMQQLAKTQLPTLYKENINKYINKEDDVKITSPFGEKTKEVFYRLDKIRGYRPPKRKAEAASIIRMLKSGYNPDQIINTWQILKKDKYWINHELFMMTIESQIGATLSGSKKINNESTNSKYDQMVKR
jgi:hypothetical protein